MIGSAQLVLQTSLCSTLTVILLSLEPIDMSIFQSCSFVTLAFVVVIGWAFHLQNPDGNRDAARLDTVSETEMPKGG
ncbi:hypothetical protein SAMN03159496_00579 [Rhizobium sp. NFR07]|nr:hypothetical protein SAMN03159496_00579 [Rhizobium sp. NFR07]